MKDEVKDYILKNESNYTRTAINNKLLADGVSQEEIVAVWSEIDQERVAALKLLFTEENSDQKSPNMGQDLDIGFYVRAFLLVATFLGCLVTANLTQLFSIGWRDALNILLLLSVGSAIIHFWSERNLKELVSIFFSIGVALLAVGFAGIVLLYAVVGFCQNAMH